MGQDQHQHGLPPVAQAGKEWARGGACRARRRATRADHLFDHGQGPQAVARRGGRASGGFQRRPAPVGVRLPLRHGRLGCRPAAGGARRGTGIPVGDHRGHDPRRATTHAVRARTVPELHVARPHRRRTEVHPGGDRDPTGSRQVLEVGRLVLPQLRQPRFPEGPVRRVGDRP